MNMLVWNRFRKRILVKKSRKEQKSCVTFLSVRISNVIWSAIFLRRKEVQMEKFSIDNIRSTSTSNRVSSLRTLRHSEFSSMTFKSNTYWKMSKMMKVAQMGSSPILGICHFLIKDFGKVDFNIVGNGTRYTHSTWIFLVFYLLNGRDVIWLGDIGRNNSGNIWRKTNTDQNTLLYVAKY